MAGPSIRHAARAGPIGGGRGRGAAAGSLPPGGGGASSTAVVIIVVGVRVLVGGQSVSGRAADPALLAAGGVVLEDLLEEGEAQDGLGGEGVALLDAAAEPAFGVRGREPDERLERAGRQGRRLALVALELVVAQGRVRGDDVIGRALGEHGLEALLRVLDVLLDEGDAEHFDLAGRAAGGRHRDAGVQHDIEGLVHGRGPVRVLLVGQADAERLAGLLAHRGALFGAGLPVAVHAEDVLGDLAVAEVVDIVGDDEEEIETREQGVGEGDVAVGVLVGVVLAVDGVRGGDDAAAGVEGGVDAGFGDGDSLLLHDFVDGDAVDVAHFVELVDADNASVCEDHGTGFEAAFPGFFVAGDSSCETNTRGASASGRNGEWSSIENESEKLGFGCRGITDHQDVDVSTKMRSVVEVLLHASKEHEKNCFFDMVVAIYTWRERLREKFENILLL